MTDASAAADRFPRLFARTRGFTLGRPRSVTVAPDGGRVAFLRSRAGDDPSLCLWVLDPGSAAPRVAADPATLDADEALLPATERARRERTRERAGGIVAYATDRDLRRAVFTLGGRLLVAELDEVPPAPAGASGGALGEGPEPAAEGGMVWEVSAAGPVHDPRLDPGGSLVAYVSGGSLYVVPTEPARSTPGGGPLLATDPGLGISWGLAEFVAAEEMGRTRGYWWSPDGRRLAVTRVDERPVRRWHLADPAEPATPPVTLAYPAAGTDNADVGLVIADLDRGTVEVAWDRAAFPYLVQVRWDEGAPLTLLVQSRDQRRVEVLTVDPASGSTGAAHSATDPAWVELVPGTPRWLPDERLVTTVDQADTRRLLVGGTAVTPPGLQVRSVVSAGPHGVVLTGWDEPTEVQVWRVGPGTPGGEDGLQRLTVTPGVHDAAAGGDTVVVVSAGLDGAPVTEVRRAGEPPVVLPSVAVEPPLVPAPRLLRAGRRALRTALLLPREGALASADGPLPVLLDPYGGPHAQRVLADRDAFLTSQWFADQGFAVVVVDGRGTPGRGPAWERAIHLDLAGPILDDQIEALHAVAEGDGRLDLTRVAIRGWSFGGYLAALAVLRRPDVFHAAVAGAPVTDWRLYDTHYTERYLGHPDRDPDGPAVYERNGLLGQAHRLSRPLLLIHGLADDNVVAAHTLRLSSALLAAGRPHAVLPLPGVTHMTPQEVVAENLLILQLTFVREALGIPGPMPGPGDPDPGAPR